jgi:flagellar biosynthesis protein FlhG
MTTEPYIITLSSQKGGVGKTTIAVNLATALGTAGYKVLLIDSDISNPSIKFFLGLKDPTLGYRDVLLGKSKLESTYIPYTPAALTVLPGYLTPDADTDIPTLIDKNADSVGKQLYKTDFHFIVIDTSPGILSEKFLKYYGEALLVTTPEMPAIASVVKLSKIYDKDKVRHNLIINRFNKNIDIDDVEELYGKKPLAELPEDDIVPLSLAKQTPAYLLNEKAPFPQGIYDLRNFYSKAVHSKVA